MIKTDAGRVQTQMYVAISAALRANEPLTAN
jgi:hypothetical protein